MSNQDDMDIYRRNIKDKILKLINSNQLKEAQELITQYQKIIPNDIEILQAQSIIFIQEGNYELAESILIQSIYLDKSNSDTFYNLGYLFQIKEKWCESFQSYQLAKQYCKDHNLIAEISNIQLELLNQQMKSGNFAEELYELFEKMVQTTEFLASLEKQQEEAHNWKNTLENLINVNQVEEAKELLAKYKNIYSNDVDFYSFQAIIDIVEERFDVAEENLMRGLEIDTNNIDILFNLGYLFELTKDNKRAHLYYSKAAVRCNQKETYEEIKNRLEEIQRKDPKLLNKRVLLVAYAFPPIGGPGVQRSLKFAKYLRKCGWAPLVLTVGWTPWNFNDESLLEEISEEIDILRIDDIDPKNINIDTINQIIPIYKELINNDIIFQEYIKSIGGNISFLPEYQALWANKVINNINDYVNLDEIDLIYTSADPNADNIIGYYLKKKYNKPWVADFRDAWTQNPYTGYDKNGLKYRVECEMEKTLVKFADYLITVSEEVSQDFIRRLNLDDRYVKTISNGYDENDFNHIVLSEGNKEYFTIAHNGLFYQKRSPITFLSAIKNILDKKLIPKEKLKVYFTRKDKWYKLVEELGLDEVVQFTGYKPHRESIELANHSNLLLLIVGSGDENKGIYTGKIYEYLRLCKPILALSPKDSVVDNLLQKLDRGKNIPFDNIADIEDYIVEMYKLWEKNNYPILKLEESIKDFDREELTNKLSKIFNSALKLNTKLMDNKNQ